MNTTKKFIMATMPLILISGCTRPQPMATTYHPFDGYEGYSDRPVGENAYEIQVHGNTITTHPTLVNHFKQRASELCNKKAFDSKIEEKVSTHLFSEYNNQYVHVPTTVNQSPYVIGKVTCSQ